MIIVAKDDTRQDYLRVTGALAFATLFITQIDIADLQHLSHRPKLALFVGLGCMLVAAGIYFFYVNGTHRKRWEVTTEAMLGLDTGTATKTLGGFYKKWRWVHRFATALFGAGALLLAYVLWALVE